MAAPESRPAQAGVNRTDSTLAGLDALELGGGPRTSAAARLWALAWPKLAAIALALAVWQVVVWSGWRPAYVLPAPGTVLGRLAGDVLSGQLLSAAAITLRRAAVGYGLAVVIGVAVGLAVSRSRPLRTAFGSLITGLQTMPSIAWFPLAILLFTLSEAAILFVVVLGAAPSIANGLVGGIDHIPPLLLRAGRVLGATGWQRYVHVVLPAALPGFVGGLKQGWAFAWRSLMAGELLVIVANQQSIGVRLDQARQLSDATGLLSTMLAILLIGIAIDALGFGVLDRSIRRRRGLVEPGS